MGTGTGVRRRPLWTVLLVIGFVTGGCAAPGPGRQAVPAPVGPSWPAPSSAPQTAGPGAAGPGAAGPGAGRHNAAGTGAAGPNATGPTAAGSGAGRPGTRDAAGRPVERAPLSLAELLARTPTFRPPPPARPVALHAAPGAAAWTNRVPTDQPVVFITIDDGYVQDPAVLAVLEKAQVSVTAFLTVYAVNHHVAYFTRLQELGARIGSHAITHRRLKDEPQWYQQEQLCGSASWLGATFGRAPRLFRPPYGLKDDTTLRVARACGYRAGVHWTHAADGRFADPEDYRLLRAGDIILLHFQQNLAQSLVDVLAAVQRAGLTPAPLDDYLAGT